MSEPVVSYSPLSERVTVDVNGLRFSLPFAVARALTAKLIAIVVAVDGNKAMESANADEE